ncbi:tyrosine-type recombinase/integrase [Arthrobacter ramosus]|uniref:Tyrosine-type recombinase/integrase n=1 Tax=Arthrobacter ramosus TaxID=1672 RepID=A0ABV5XTW2_ARTRM|nr:tyrosine-type recombinase/integrase [Arthrobacter ramosus]
MSALESLVGDYLRLRRGLGFKLATHERYLTEYLRYLERSGQETVTTENILGWARTPGGAASYHGARLSVARSFARWAHAFDSSIEVPPRQLLPARSPRAVPFIYSDEQVLALLEQARLLRSPMVAATYRTLIGLLACTGMRVSEAINANRSDLDAGVLSVADTKFGKSRLVPLHSSVLEVLADYALTRHRLLGPVSTEALLVSSAGTRLIYKNVHRVFHRLVARAGITPKSQQCRPRIHDLRHSFAVTTMIGAYRDGAVPAEVLPVLSTYLGHASPGSTYWYLEAVPELLAEAGRRLGPLQAEEQS